MEFLFGKAKNPTVKNTLKQRFNEGLCEKVGHIEFGSYYGMPQAHCSRCGSWTRQASESAKYWEDPND